MDPINVEADKIQLCAILRCLAEEWGNDHFELHLPRHWAKHIVARPVFKFVTDNKLVLIIGSQNLLFRREIELAKSCCLPGDCFI